MKNPWLVAPMVFGLVGCQLAEGDFDASRSVPTERQVSLKVPGQQALTASGGGKRVEQAVGGPAYFHAMAYTISTTLNAEALVLLGIIRGVVRLQPSSQTANSRTWGPFGGNGLEALVYKLTATKVAGEEYTIELAARPKTSSSDSDWKVLLDGRGVREDEDHGQGHITLHLDTQRMLDPTRCGDGTVTFRYDSTQEPRSIAVELRGFTEGNAANPACRRDDSAKDADYKYEEGQDGAGQFTVVAKADIHDHENKPMLEDLKIRARWQADGAGRADVTIGGGEVSTDLAAASLGAGPVTVSECWSSAFKVVYETSTPIEIRTTAGDPASCAFTTAQLP